MDHFESIISTLLEAQNYWVRRSFKVKVTPADKEKIKKLTIPRPEIDLLALHFSKNQVIAFEVKSFLNSPGVRLADLQKEHDVSEGRYKLFTSQRYREVVLSRLLQDLIDCDMANSDTKVFLGLAAGKVYQNKSGPIRDLLKEKGFIFWSPEDIRDKVKALAGLPYENDPAIITAKILLPDMAHRSQHSKPSPACTASFLIK
jgi:hypothetical protein